ncbi:MAG: hypothetical protein A4E35_01906 [Methanoregula sp. PtaU1.Bin051]|nr:MAG: hypothetical protein A4E35_01906 [Methanoregula sp. PtaU1.Bin051]
MVNDFFTVIYVVKVFDIPLPPFCRYGHDNKGMIHDTGCIFRGRQVSHGCRIGSIRRISGEQALRLWADRYFVNG